MHFDYRLTGRGWATVTIECSGQSVEFVASYLTDPLRDLADGVSALCAGAHEVAVDFIDEPGEHRLTLTRAGDKSVDLEVLEYEGWLSVHPSLQPKQRLLVGRTTLAHVRGQLYSAMTRLLEQHGLRGYRKMWVNHDFPETAYEALGRAVA